MARTADADIHRSLGREFSRWLDGVRCLATITDILPEYADNPDYYPDLALRIVPLFGDGCPIEVVACDQYWGISMETVGQLAARLRLKQPRTSHLLIAGVEPCLSESVALGYCDAARQGLLFAETAQWCNQLVGARMRAVIDLPNELRFPTWSAVYSSRSLTRLLHISIHRYSYAAW